MISIIICCRNKQISSELHKNIEETIGCRYEIIVVDNSDNKYSIFSAYNEGIELSRGTCFCFIHDDILFHTKNWGKELLEIFERNKNIGLIGVAGTKFKSKMPSAWWECPQKYHVINIIQHFHDIKKEKEHWNIGFKSNIEEVCVIDGVLMCFGNAAIGVKFDETLSGFHNYDLNASVEVSKINLKIVVINSIVIEHFSSGELNKQWVESSMSFYNLNKKKMPLATVKIDEFQKRNIEFNNGILFVERLLQNDKKIIAIRLWLTLLKFKPFSKYHFKFIKKII